MDIGLKGKRALVTGASRGIGRAIAEALAAEGCALQMLARNAEALDAAAAEIGRRYGVAVATHAIDLSRSGAAEEAAAQYADVDIVVNNAGSTPRGDILSVDEDAWRQGWDLKVFGYINLTREFYRHMQARGDGVIINIIGISAEKYEYAYAAGGTGNAALAAMTRIVGGASLDHGVRVLGVHPGWVETGKARRSLMGRAAAELGDEQRWPELVKSWPRGRLIQPEEVANVVAFLASPRAGAMSGTIVTVDAGFTSRGYPYVAKQPAPRKQA
ncbi:short-chain dehydrogenase/reductase [Candidimonas nitroreducens]|uniref:Short-chain dehydrogenase n=1 Tax=Candidimonas nitroreducens TaxID=683354 RepID=A0A225MRQ8_9BURK|nr:short-chain dehydrogenase/reductase [Candidimonas nitroreducens]OWT63925.1 short-chain dehydrogenase [Candidimonas nitroreducens]